MHVVILILISLGMAACAPGSRPSATIEPTPHHVEDARAWITAGIDAMGGGQALASLSRVRLEGTGHEYGLEQSERLESPQYVTYLRVVEVHDASASRTVRITSDLATPGDTWRWELADPDHGLLGIDTAQGPQLVRARFPRQERARLSPEAVLAAAAAAADLTVLADTELEGNLHHVVGFTIGPTRVKLWLGATTSLPAAVEYVTAFPDDGFWGPWGDVAVRIMFSYWEHQDAGVWYPMQWDELRAGLPFRTVRFGHFVAGGLTPDEAHRLDTLEHEVKTAPPARSREDVKYPDTAADAVVRTIAPGIVQLAGAWNVGIVVQDDGIVVLDAPISSGYSASILAKIAELYPHARIKAVISSSGAYPHFGGLREYVARGIPVYAPATNTALIGRFVAAPHHLHPDALDRAPRPLQLTSIRDRQTLGQGRNAIELVPVRQESGERMLVAVLPAARVLYSSDLVQRWPNGNFGSLDPLDDLRAVLRREHVAVDRAFGFHVGATPWLEIEAALQARTTASAPAAS